MFFSELNKTISVGWSQDQHFLHRRFKPSRLRQALEYGFPDDEMKRLVFWTKPLILTR